MRAIILTKAHMAIILTKDHRPMLSIMAKGCVVA